MAGLFRKRHCNKPWLASTILTRNRNFKSKVVKVLCRRSQSVYGSCVMLVSDGELSISAVFSDEAISGLSDLGMGSSNWSTALLILQEYTLELKEKPGQEFGEYVLYVEKFNIWDLQPGYQAKYDVKSCMEHEPVFERMKEELKERKERAACQTESSMTGSVALTQLLEEIAEPSISLSDSQVNTEQDIKCTTDLTESLIEKLVQPFTVEEFLIPAAEASILENIKEWKPAYQPSLSEDLGESLSEEQFDVCAADTLSQDHGVRSKARNIEKKRNKELTNEVKYLGLSFVSSPEEIGNKIKAVERQSQGPVCAFLKLDADSQSQGTSSQWQEELESVKFSFEEESCTPGSQRSPEEPCRPVNMESTVGHITVKESSGCLMTDAVLKSAGPFSMASSEGNSKKHVIRNYPGKEACDNGTEKNSQQTCIDSYKASPAKTTLKVVSDEIPKKTAVLLDSRNSLRKRRIWKGQVCTKIRLFKKICKPTFSNTQSQEICTLTTDCLDLGPPTAQSTQIDDDDEDIKSGSLQGDEKGGVEDLLKSTEENETVPAGGSKTSDGQSQSLSQCSEQIECEIVSPIHKGLQLSKKITQPSLTFSHESSVKTASVDQNHVSTDTFEENTNDSASNDLDTSVMQSYNSQNSKLPSRNWYNDMIRLSEKKKNLEALKYITKRISDVINGPNKSSGSEMLVNQDNSFNAQGGRSKEKEVNGPDINGLTSKYLGTDEVRCDLSQEGIDGKVKALEKKKSKKTKNVPKTDNENLDESTGERKETNFCKISQDIKQEFDWDSTNVLIDKNNEENTQLNTAETTDTGYPVSSLSLRETFEESQNCLLPCDIVLNQTNLEEIDRFHSKRIAEHSASGTRQNCGEDSDQTNLDEIDKAYQSCIRATNGKIKVLSKEVPEYFNTESGSKKRSARLYARVISCREKDDQISGTNVRSKTLVSPILMSSSNGSNVKRDVTGTEYIESFEGDKNTAQDHDEFTDDGNASGVETNQAMTVAGAEPTADEQNGETSDQNQKIRNIKSGDATKLTQNDNIKGQSEMCEKDKHTSIMKKCESNIFESPCKKQVHPKLVKDGVVISDILTVLERCDQNEKKKMEMKKSETQNNVESCYRVSEHGKMVDFTKFRNDKVKIKQTEPGCSGLSPEKYGNIAEQQTAENANDKSGDHSSNNNLPQCKIVGNTPGLMNNKSRTDAKTGKLSNRRNRSEMVFLSDLENSGSRAVRFVSRKCETLSVPEMRRDLAEKTVDKTDAHQEENENIEAVTRIKVKKFTVENTFENQFKKWLGKVKSNGNEEKGHNSPHKLYCRKNHTESAIQSNKPVEEADFSEFSLLENVPFDSSEHAELPDSHNRSDGDIFDTDKEDSMENCDKEDSRETCDIAVISSQVQSTQPFDVCKYPETQEFTPEMSETDLLPSRNESSTIHNKDLSYENKCPEALSKKFGVAGQKRSNVSEKTIELKNRLTKDSQGNDKVHKTTKEFASEKGKELVYKFLNTSVQKTHAHEKVIVDKQDQCLKANITRDTESSSMEPIVNEMSPNLWAKDIGSKNCETLQNSAQSVLVLESASDKQFTKLIGKSEHKIISDDSRSVYKLEKLDLKVKPIQRKDIKRKRKTDKGILDDINTIKRQKCIEKESKEEVKSRDSKRLQKEEKDCEFMNETANNSDDSHTDFKDTLNIKTQKKPVAATKGRLLEKMVGKVDQDKSRTLKNHVPVFSSEKSIETYEPRKMFIDGHCFGNKVFWQNFVESPYNTSRQISSDTKNKSCLEMTNKRKLSLDSSHGSQSQDRNSMHCKTSKDAENEKVNRSSESLFSDKNEMVDSNSDSVSLLQCKKTEIKELRSNDSVRNSKEQGKLKVNKTARNEHETIQIGGELRYLKTDGPLRFYRVKDATNRKSKDLDASTTYSSSFRKDTNQCNRMEKENATGKTSFDRVSENRFRMEEDSSGKNIDKVTGKNATMDNKACGRSKSKVSSVDKQLFIQDWLMKHKEIGEQDSTSQEMSSPDISTPKNSLPSYQPVGISRERRVHSEDQTNVAISNNEERERKDNSLDGTSTSESSSSSESDDSDKPLSAAEKYFMKLKKAGKEKKKRKLLAFKSNLRTQAHDYLKSHDRL